MKNEACVQRIVYAVAGELAAGQRDNANISKIREVIASGVIQPDRATRTVTVAYDSLKLSLKNVEFSIAKAGFDANNTPANKKAADNLPPECR